MKRKPYVAGHFYPDRQTDLLRNLKQLLVEDQDPVPAVAVVAPHAGYMYSGGVAGAVYGSVIVPNRLVLLGPSHHPITARFGLMRIGAWGTPLGDVPIDTKLAGLILKQSELISEDFQAHAGEHSLEVQLPFLRYVNPEIQIVPITTTYFASFSDLEQLGKAVAAAIRELAENVLIVASTDMSHQVSRELAQKKDALAIERIKALDARGLYDVVQAEQISMCGFQATSAALIAAKELGAEIGELIRYQTSGDVTGDTDSVVGYAGLRIR
jgi:AmmeMemoRadiSam system protein B